MSTAPASHEPPTTGTKFCPTCTPPQFRHVLAFATRRASADGLCPICRDCKRRTRAVRPPLTPTAARGMRRGASILDQWTD